MAFKVAKGLPRFITLEGGDGSGKSTLLARIERLFQERGIAYVVTREPGGTPLAEEIRELVLKPRVGHAMSALTELFLYEAARAEHVEHVIKPALAAGKVVLCDRFTYSSLAYQGIARGLGLELVRGMNAVATQGLEPDLVIWLKLRAADARARMAGRTTALDRLEGEKASFHDTVYGAFELLARQEPERIAVLDATSSPDDVFDALLTHPLWQVFS